MASTHPPGPTELANLSHYRNSLGEQGILRRIDKLTPPVQVEVRDRLLAAVQALPVVKK